MTHHVILYIFFFFNDTATTEIYTLSLHDALPICPRQGRQAGDLQLESRPEHRLPRGDRALVDSPAADLDRKSTRLNSSHLGISYAVFCLKKKKKRAENSICWCQEETASVLRHATT